MTQHSCEETKTGTGCCGCCDDVEDVIVRLDREFRGHLASCESEDAFALLRFRYLSAKGVINSLLQKVSFDVDAPQLFQETVASIFGFKTFVRTMFFLHSFETQIVVDWLSGEGLSADLSDIADSDVQGIIETFVRDQSEKSPFTKLALHEQYLGSEGVIATAWSALKGLPESAALSKGVDLLKAECMIETSFYFSSRAADYLLGTDTGIQWTDEGVYLAEVQFDNAITNCESIEEGKALYEAYLGSEGVFEKRLAQFTSKELTSDNSVVRQWLAFRDYVTSAFDRKGISTKVAKVRRS